MDFDYDNAVFGRLGGEINEEERGEDSRGGGDAATP